MSLEKVGLYEAIRLGFGEPTVVVKLPFPKKAAKGKTEN